MMNESVYYKFGFLHPVAMNVKDSGFSDVQNRLIYLDGEFVKDDESKDIRPLCNLGIMEIMGEMYICLFTVAYTKDEFVELPYISSSKEFEVVCRVPGYSSDPFIFMFARLLMKEVLSELSFDAKLKWIKIPDEIGRILYDLERKGYFKVSRKCYD